MKTELNFLELHFLVQELQVCIGSRVDKIYQPDGFLFQLHKSGAGKLFLRIADKLLWLSKAKPEAPEPISGLCGALRRYLEGKKLAKLEQLGSERIVRFTFETQKETFFVHVELFQQGNLILTDATGRILAAKEERAWKDREIRRGLVYVPPPAKADLFALKEIPADEKSLASLGFGKLLAREILARGGGINAYQSLLKEKFSPREYSDGELSPIGLVQYTEVGKPYSSFSALIDERLPRAIESVKETRARQLFESKRAKLQEVIDLQSKNIAALEKEALELQRRGEIIYEHYQELQEILDEIKRMKEVTSLQEVKAKLKGHPKIKDLNPKTSDVVVETK